MEETVLPQRYEICIGEPLKEHVLIQVLSRMHLEATDALDGNWLISPIVVVAGGFRADVGAGLRSDELIAFREQLQTLAADLRGKAVLSSLEDWIELEIAVDRLGALTVKGSVGDRPGGRNRLHFEIDGLDQTDLKSWIATLERVERAFPSFEDVM